MQGFMYPSHRVIPVSHIKSPEPSTMLATVPKRFYSSSLSAAARKFFVGGNWKCNGSLSDVQVRRCAAVLALAAWLMPTVFVCWTFCEHLAEACEHAEHGPHQPRN
jgi:hypothetical protein